jgi:hypothetical protein
MILRSDGMGAGVFPGGQFFLAWVSQS